jgi:sugar phosphate isomerase/epimerase
MDILEAFHIKEEKMQTRRNFLGMAAMGTIAGVGGYSFGALGATPGPRQLKIRVPVGLQLYSLRYEFKKDVLGTLRLVRDMGFKEIEGGDTYGMTLKEYRQQLDSLGLRCTSIGGGYEQLRDNLPKVVETAKGLDATFVMCAWIPHGEKFTEKECDQAITDFNHWGTQLKKAGLRFMFHVHGYEFYPSKEGTLFDRMAQRMEPGVADFQMDVFWVAWPGQDPVALLRKYPKRFLTLHLKDLRKGAKGDLTGHAPDEYSVILGQGMIDFPTIFKEAKQLGIERYYIEDEVPEAAANIPRSLDYLESLKI